MGYDIRYSCISHIGHVRSMNQDNFICHGQYMDSHCAEDRFPLCGTSTTPSLFGIFDGMGGEERGEVASYIAAKEASFTRLEKDGVSVLADYCKRANDKICEYAKKNAVSAMGTTAAMLLFSKGEITLCNIGDSKVFRLADGELGQISKDHVVISVFGTKPPLSQNLGIPPDVLQIEPYLSQGGYKDGDRYLICSDGLTDMLPVKEITALLMGRPIEEAATDLVDHALKNGGRDNVTVILLEIIKRKNKLLSFWKGQKGGKLL